MIAQQRDHDGVAHPQLGTPIKLLRQPPGRCRSTAPIPGQDTRRYLEIAGLEPAKIDELSAQASRPSRAGESDGSRPRRRRAAHRELLGELDLAGELNALRNWHGERRVLQGGILSCICRTVYCVVVRPRQSHLTRSFR